MPRKEGEHLVEDFYFNAGGLNSADSPFAVKSNQASDGYNWDYIQRGAVRKRPGHAKLNTSATTELKSLGFGLWDKPGSNRKVIRAAGRKLQDFDTSAFTFTNLTEDTTLAGSDFLASSTTQPVVKSMFNTPSAGTLWIGGGGVSNLYGVYSSTKVTANGVPALTTSAFTATQSAAGTGSFTAIGTYRYTLVFRKASTQALGNASTTVEASATISATTDKIALAWTVSNNDTTKYDKIYIYRSSVGGSTAFTAGVLLTTVNSNVTSYDDLGPVTESSVNVPRANSTVLDNSALPAGTFNVVTTWKKRLVTASGSTLYISDTNKPESWPTVNYITVPSGGDITGLAVLGSNSQLSSDSDEYLVIFKQRELWIVTGTGLVDQTTLLPDLSLKYVGTQGTVGQSLVVSADGYLAWLNYRGVFLWDGSGKPTYVSRPIQDKFQRDGDIDKSKLNIAWGEYVPARSEIQWYLSSGTYGEQKYVLKLDLNLTTQGSESTLDGRVLDGVFTPDVTAFAVYAGLSFLISTTATEELMYLGDNAGYVYSGYSSTADGSTAVSLAYTSPYLTFDRPTEPKRVYKVVAYVLDNGQYDLSLDFWSEYRFQDEEASTQTQPVSANTSTVSGIWDVNNWDEFYWDESSNRIRRIIFNLSSTKNNLEGDSFRLRFRESSTLYQPVLYGFSLYYTPLPSRK